MMRPTALLRTFDRDTRWQSGAHRALYYACAACLSLYLSYALFLAQSPVFESALETALSLVWFALIAAALFGALLWLCRRAPGRAGSAERGRLDARLFALAGGLALVALGCGLARCWPGGFSTDAAKQWAQVQSGEYNNWHPVFHTLLMRLGTLARNSYPFLVLQQIVALSLALGYLIATLAAWGAKRWALIAAELVIVSSSLFGNAAMHVWKDDALTLGALVLCAQTANIWRSRGAWLSRPRNAVALGLALAFTTLVRHNGFLFTVPLIAALALAYRPLFKRALIAAGTMVAVIALVLGPVYQWVGVTYPDNMFEESVGVPMTVLCDARVKNPDALSPDARAFLDEMAADEEWATLYRAGNYNSIKFADWETRRLTVAGVDRARFWRMVADTAAADPRTAFEAVNAVTDLVWGLSGNKATVSLRGTDHIGEYYAADTPLTRAGSALMTALDVPAGFAPIAWYTRNIGVSFAWMLAWALRRLYRHGPAALALCLPTLLYNLGTMCLLCGNDARFFQYSLALCTLMPLLPGPPEQSAIE